MRPFVVCGIAQIESEKRVIHPRKDHRAQVLVTRQLREVFGTQCVKEIGVSTEKLRHRGREVRRYTPDNPIQSRSPTVVGGIGNDLHRRFLIPFLQAKAAGSDRRWGILAQRVDRGFLELVRGQNEHLRGGIEEL